MLYFVIVVIEINAHPQSSQARNTLQFFEIKKLKIIEQDLLFLQILNVRDVFIGIPAVKINQCNFARLCEAFAAVGNMYFIDPLFYYLIPDVITAFCIETPFIIAETDIDGVAVNENELRCL